MQRNERTFTPADVRKLEDPERLVWLPPAEVVASLELRPGMCVADVGAGTGYFSLPLAAAVAPGGVVKAVDFEPEMLAFLRGKLAAQDAPANVEMVQGSALATTLPEASCDLALLANVWHELDALGAVLAETRRILRGGGRIAILDWRTDVTRPPGPPLEHRVPVQTVSAALAADGWLVPSGRNTGTYSYLVTAVRPW
jgi:ubiquinone/menaquinone biosynthesis C-methylase UbiE